MSHDYTLVAEPRVDAGKGASRRLRRNGRIPGIIYGAGQSAQALTFGANELTRLAKEEAFFSSVLSVQVGGESMQAVVRDCQVHPARRQILHIDLQRILATEKLRLNVPLHFINEEACKGVKQGGGTFSHLLTEVEVSCLPKDLPEYIEVDVGQMDIDDTLHLSDLKLPDGVEIPELALGPDHDQPVISLHVLRVREETEEEEGAAEETGEDESRPESAADNDS